MRHRIPPTGGAGLAAVGVQVELAAEAKLAVVWAGRPWENRVEIRSAGWALFRVVNFNGTIKSSIKR